MQKLNIHQEILDWSIDQPLWQRDALRRLVTQGDVNDDDIADLASLCKSQHGLETHRDGQPLDKRHLPTGAGSSHAVTLLSLTHHAGVNALAPNQTVRFSDNLTVVYGDNGAGKSGYTRILKRACRARGAEPILGDVTSTASPTRPSATIKYRHGKRERDYAWSDSPDREIGLSRVSVFDSHCASVYVSQRMDVAFRPLGLDLFDHLASVCERVKGVLEKEMVSLRNTVYQLPNLPETTATGRLLNRLTLLTTSDEVRALGVLSANERQRMDELRARIEDLSANNPHERAQALGLRADRVGNLIAHLEELDVELAQDRITALLQVAQELNAANATRQALLEAFASMPLPNTGSEHWHHLWKAARTFSNSDSYATTAFPFVGAGARCVLCQQLLLEEGVQRLQDLARHADTATHDDHQRRVRQHESDVARLVAVAIDGSIRNTIDEVALDHREIAEGVRQHLVALAHYRDAALVAIRDRNRLLDRRPAFDKSALRNFQDVLRSRASEIMVSSVDSEIDALRLELAELKAREVLGDNIDVVLREIRRRGQLALYEKCIQQTRTHMITRKSTDVTKRAVTGQLVSSFSDELDRLGFVDVEVELAQAGGSRGSFYHKVILTRAPASDVAKVVSEGEARCLSIASFFAEISTADDPSAILFDDPVSSLDQRWRHKVAERLAKEATRRQVVVFTHDLVFWRGLEDEAKRLGIGCDIQYLRRTQRGTGALSDSVPSPAMNVSKRIGNLKQRWVAAEKFYRMGHQDEYEVSARDIYGLLREAWERGVEETLLHGVVERYRVSVETKSKILKLADITETDCKAVQNAITKCSIYFRGHDTPAADNPPFPNPDEVERDIEALFSWHKGIGKRRK